MINNGFHLPRRRGFGWRVWLGGLCASLLLPAPAFAQAPTRRPAEELFKTALGEINAKNWPMAWQLLSAAYKLDPQPDYAVNLGFVELKLDKHRDAAEHLTFFLREARDASRNDRQRVEEKLGTAKKKIGTIAVRVEPAGAEVRVDGQFMGMAPLPGLLFVEPGRRTFEARKEGLPPESQEIDVAAGSERTVELRMEPPPVERSGPKPPLPPKTGDRRDPWMVSGIVGTAVLGAAGVGTAIGAIVAYQHSMHQWETHGCSDATGAARATCESAFQDVDKQRYYLANTAFWTGLGAVAVGAGTAIYWWTKKKPEIPGRPQASLMLGPKECGLFVTGQW